MKRLVALFIVVLMSINTLGAVVSDNDGSAFITKAEFDSLKNDFQAQIDQYNTSIDMKIDGAIAAYLAGIKTVASETSKVLVDNYSDMMWVRNYDIYGRWKKWTANTTYTSNMSNSWYTPSLNEKRHSFRQPGFNFYSPIRFAYSYVTTWWMFTPSSANNGAALAPTTGWPFQNVDHGVPVLAIRLNKNSAGMWNVVGTTNTYDTCSYAFADHHLSSENTQSAWNWGGQRNIVSNMEILSKADTDILKFKITATAKDTGVGTNSFVDTLNPSNMAWPAIWSTDYNSSSDRFDTQEQVYNTAWSTNNFFNTGCTWHSIYNKSLQDQFLTKMMFGQSNSQQVNTAYYISYDGEYGIYDFTKSTTSATLTGKITGASLQSRNYNLSSDGLTSTYRPLNIDCSMSVPHWPTENLRDLTSGVFEYNSKGLKFGEGMPLRIDNQTNGYLQISFDSSVNEILTGSAHSNQNLKIDIRKENFLSSSANWAQGYKGLVNPDSTSETLVELRNYQYTTTDGKIKLTVPMKKDESLWIRIAPWTSDKGYCAKWSNLSMTMNTN